MKVNEIRERFLKFFEQHGHTIYPSDSLVPANDPTLLFTGAGMNQFKEEFMGRVKGSRRAATCQKCLRTGDLENVGRTPGHHTFFEMLGNFSFGDYFKKDAIVWAWEFLTKELGLKESDLWVSVYTDDGEAYDVWKQVVKVPEKKITRLGAKENFWPSNAPTDGPDGPCGPCSEIFYGGTDGVEVWNLVFTQFDRKDGGRLDPLPGKNIDTGMGIERLARVIQGKKTNFEIDSFLPIINEIKGGDPRRRPLGKAASRINAIADHIRAVTFAIADGALPSNEGRGYVIRKLIRRAFWYGRFIGKHDQPFLYKLVPVVAKVMKKPYPELTEQREDIAQVVLVEEKRFANTITEGTHRLREMVEDSRSSGILSGKNAFRLYDTYGLPLEITQEIVGGEKINIDLKGFERCMKEQRTRSREGSKIVSDSIFMNDSPRVARLPKETAFLEDKEEIETKVLQKERSSVFLEKTNFYGEKGGQVGDTGWLIKDNKVVAEVIDAVDVAGRVQHEVKIKKGELKKGDQVTAKIDIKRRDNIRKNHTATHILHNALRRVLGQHVKQAGSLVAPDRLRFDFTHFKALADDEISRVEGLVKECIKNSSCVDTKEIGFNEAKKQGAIALFGEKYGEKVRMVCVGNYSKELCGGTHVKETKDIGLFKIVSESSIASGVRRIEAVTGDAAYKKIKEERDLIKQIASELRTTPANIVKEIEKVSDRIKNLEKGLKDFSIKSAQSNIGALLKDCKRIKDYDVIVAEIKNADMDLLRKSSDLIKGKLKKVIFVLVSEKNGRLSMVVGSRGSFNAVKILNHIGADFGIKGGGRPDFAQAGSRRGADIKKILRKAEEVIKKIMQVAEDRGQRTEDREI